MRTVTAKTAASVEAVGDPHRASVLMHPLRIEVLRAAQRPGSASDFARRLGHPRQNVNYHVRELARAGFLEPVGERRKQNVIEKRYVASARSYVLLPQLLGPLAAGTEREGGALAAEVGDGVSAAHLLALAARTQTEVTAAAGAAAVGRGRLPTLALDAELRFESAAQRSSFAEALTAAVVDVVARFSSPAEPSVGRRGRGRPYRLLVACHPKPAGGGVAGERREG